MSGSCPAGEEHSTIIRTKVHGDGSRSPEAYCVKCRQVVG